MNLTPTTEIEIVSDPRLYIKFWAQEHKKLSVQDLVSKASLQGTYLLDYKALRRKLQTGFERKLPLVKDNDLILAYQEYIEENFEIQRKQTIADLKCEESNLTPLFQFVEAITGDVSEVDAAVLAHWCWMVKQNAQNKKTTYQIMPVLFGPQGSGKTIAIEQLIEPLKDFRLDLHLDKIGDEKYWDGFSKNLIVFFDELSGASRTEISSLKHIISAKVLSYRKMYSHSVSSVKQACSFIGCTNKNTFEVLWDPTGARRFWEIKTLPKINHELINSIDYVALWKGIDETLKDGYMAPYILAAMNKVQVKNTIEDVLSSFIGSLDMSEPGEQQEVELNLLYRHFDFFCRNAGEKVMSRNRFRNQLVSRGYEVTMDGSTGVRKNFVKISVAAAKEINKPITHLASVV